MHLFSRYLVSANHVSSSEAEKSEKDYPDDYAGLGTVYEGIYEYVDITVAIKMILFRLSNNNMVFKKSRRTFFRENSFKTLHLKCELWSDVILNQNVQFFEHTLFTGK